METFFITVFGTFMIIVGRLMLTNWFNHLTIYSAIWTIVLGLNSLRLIKYNSMIPEAWIFIIAAWILLYLGSATVLCANATVRKRISSTSITRNIKKNQAEIDHYLKYIRIVILILSGLGLVGIILQWLILFREFGGFLQIILRGHKLYTLRTRGVLSMGIPYLNILSLSGMFFAGLYTSIRRKITWIVSLPVALTVIYSIGHMGRTPIIIAGVLFISAFLLHSKYIVMQKKRLLNLRNFVVTTIILLILLAAFDFIKIARSVGETYKRYGESKKLSELSNIPFFTPSVYFYLSGPPVTFSEYLKAGGEAVYFGRYTLGTIYRFLSKFGLIEHLTYTQVFYSTPVPMNTATYLRELHADYHEWGVLIFPFLLGLLCTTFNTAPRKKLWHIAVYSYLYVVIVMSFTYNIVSTGHWFINIVVTLIAVSIINHLTKSKIAKS